jgi:hypothetical protein
MGRQTQNEMPLCSNALFIVLAALEKGIFLLGRVLIHAQIATPPCLLLGVGATVALKGDDRVSDRHASQYGDIYRNGSPGFGGNADSAETADLGSPYHRRVGDGWRQSRLAVLASSDGTLASRRASNGVARARCPK